MAQDDDVPRGSRASDSNTGWAGLRPVEDLPYDPRLSPAGGPARDTRLTPVGGRVNERTRGLARILGATRNLEDIKALNNVRELAELLIESGPTARGASDIFGPAVVDYLTLPDPRAGNQGARGGGIGSLDPFQYGEDQYGVDGPQNARDPLGLGRWGLVAQGGAGPGPQAEGALLDKLLVALDTIAAYHNDAAVAVYEYTHPRISGSSYPMTHVAAAIVSAVTYGYILARGSDYVPPERHFSRDLGPDDTDEAARQLAAVLMKRFNSPGNTWEPSRRDPKGPGGRPAADSDKSYTRAQGRVVPLEFGLADEPVRQRRAAPISSQALGAMERELRRRMAGGHSDVGVGPRPAVPLTGDQEDR